MHQAVICLVKDKLRLFVDEQQLSIYGDMEGVSNIDDSWQRIVNNINIKSDELELLLIYDKFSSNILKNCTKYFSNIHTLKLLDFEYVFECLSAICSQKAISIGNYVICRDITTGMLSYGNSQEYPNCLIVPFEKLLSIQKSITKMTIELKQKENKIKKLTKELNKI